MKNIKIKIEPLAITAVCVWFVAVMLFEFLSKYPYPYQLLISCVLFLFLSVIGLYKEE